jgi:hypothetical protein
MVPFTTLGAQHQLSEPLRPHGSGAINANSACLFELGQQTVHGRGECHVLVLRFRTTVLIS